MKLGSTMLLIAMVAMIGCKKESAKDVTVAAGSPEQRAQDSVKVVADSMAQADTGRVPTSLGASRWRLLDFESPSYKRATPEPGTAYTIAFSGDGQVTILADCNRATGPWSSQRKNGLTLGPLAATMAACKEGSMSEQFLRDLNDVQAYRWWAGACS